MKLVRGGGALVARFGSREFREAVGKAFPDLLSDLDEDAGIHFVMGVLDRAIMAAIRHDEYSRARSIVEFVDALLERLALDPEIPNAVCISFVEPESLEASELGRRLWKDMPIRIRQLVLENKNRMARPGQ